MTRELVLGLYVFALAVFVGYEVIARVPAALHTPLMSATNAIHGVVLLGAILIAGAADSLAGHILGFIALVFGAANVFGGFAVTERMLALFRSEKREKR
jgi:H+-translocating NAD(P) transhydrogenase subunit alpha